MSVISRSEAKVRLQERQRTWLRSLCQATGLKPTQLAKKAGVSDTTISRLLNNPDYLGALSEPTIERLKSTYNIPGPGQALDNQRKTAAGVKLLLAEAERLAAEEPADQTLRALEILGAGRTGLEYWRINSNHLENAGYLPGDVVLVDTEADPKPQDAVCAIVNDWQRGGYETVWRIYDPPYLVSHAPRGTGTKPLVVDGERVQVRGVIIASMRPHPLSSAS